MRSTSRSVVRNAGSGLAVLDRWDIHPERPTARRRFGQPMVSDGSRVNVDSAGRDLGWSRSRPESCTLTIGVV